MWPEPLDSALIWDEIRSYSDVEKRGVGLFSGSRRERREKWQALNDFARQSKAYFDALEATAGSSRGLLGYYSALNLAKAELVHFCAEEVIDRGIGHGLSFSFSPTTINGDYVTVTSGVFPRLYEARMGRSIPKGTRLPVTRLLARIPEIGREYAAAFGHRSMIDIGYLRIVGDGANYWLNVLFQKTIEQISLTREFATAQRHLDVVERDGTWRTMFTDLSSKEFPPTYLESRKLYPVINGTVPISSLRDELHAAFPGALTSPTDGRGDVVVVPSLKKSQAIPISPYLARYAVMFYLSSLVRYRPSRLNPSKEQLTAWLLEAFARQSPGLLLANGLEGIIQKDVVFNA